MKIELCLFLNIVLACMANSQAATFLTNHACIGNRGICFSISDTTAINSNCVLFSDAPLFLILDNPTTNYVKMHSLDYNQAFTIKLFDSREVEMPLTDYGRLMNSSPTALSNLVTGSIHFTSIKPGCIQIRDFPVLEKMFSVKNVGEYFLEVRCWYIPISSKPNIVWKLSDPIRLKVFKRELSIKASVPLVDTNTKSP